MNREQAVVLARQALGLPDSVALEAERVAQPTRNVVFHIRSPHPAYLKVYREDSVPGAGAHEACVFDALRGGIPVPRVIGNGRCSRSGVEYLLTEEVPGEALERVLAGMGDQEVEPVLQQVEHCLARVRGSESLRSALATADPSWEGPHGREFCPQRWLAEHDAEFSRLVEGLARPVTWPLLGSVSGNNVFVRRAGDSGVVISAFLDMEGARLGPAGFDQATVWYDLMFDGQLDAADRWLERILGSRDEAMVAGTLANAAWLCAFRSRTAHAERARDETLRPTVCERLRKARGTAAGVS